MKKKLQALFIPLFVQLPVHDTDMSRKPVSIWEDIREKGKLIVLTRHAPTTYYHDDATQQGFEYELTQQLAQSLNIDVEYKVYDNTFDIMAALAAGEGHIAAAGLTPSEYGAKHFQYGPSYKTVEQQVVCNKRGKLPKTNEDLLNHSLLVIADSRSDEKLSEIRQQYPELSWQSTTTLSTEQVLEQVANGAVDCTVVESNIVTVNRLHFPNLINAYTLSEEKLAWALPNNSSTLRQYIGNWLARIQSDSTLKAINERYYGYAELFDYHDAAVFLQRVKKRLPKYKSYFKQVAADYNIPWTLLATQAYGESEWNPDAKSPTGVRGLMMLTNNTAKSLGVNDRLNPRQSIRGGAKYMQQLLKRIPQEVAEEDRIWFAMAAYNIGIAHLYDARELARKMGKNPNVWADIKQVLPLLSERRHFKNLKYGYAAGKDSVKYIDRIRLYHDLLRKTETSTTI
ncbi:membrane-bound lytic murein transglycosylase MltF [Methylotuvimicrobium sp. KM1]|uniref:membrane-bound lytic murein transglycosylase MltF n=1 Tax=Methylotuvimicrobium sp. KM1 TaxID=3377707 RepID=UPI00384FFC85